MTCLRCRDNDNSDVQINFFSTRLLNLITVANENMVQCKDIK